MHFVPALPRRRHLARATLLGLVLPLLALPPASAGPVDAGWSISASSTEAAPAPINIAETTSDGGQSAASMTYNYDLGVAGGVPEQYWDFTTEATGASADGPVTVPYTWQGLHAWAGVTARLEMVVEDGEGELRTVGVLYDPPIQWCCTTPSNGFVTSGVATFTDLTPGQRYGFRLLGSNMDFNSLLRGTFTLSTKPYVEALGDDNRQWTGARELGASGDEGTLAESGEARWWKIPVIPGEQVSVNLHDLPADYDLALYGDIGAAFDRLGSGTTPLDLTKLAAGASGTTPGNETQVPQYPSVLTDVPTSAAEAGVGTQFAPRVYAPRVYAPRVYAPRVYAPRVYAPRVYAPRVYAGDAYSPDLTGSENFRDAFAAAQTQTLLAVSTRTGRNAETVSAGTGNSTGWFYVRVQGHGDQDFDADQPFTITRTISGAGDCSEVHGYTRQPGEEPAPNVTGQSTVIVTDTSRMTFADGDAEDDYVASLANLADRTDGVVLDVADDPAVEVLQAQADQESQCAYAVNLAAEAVREVIAAHRGPDTRYVVLAGGDEVVPFFRYPDTSGFGDEQGFELKDDLSGQPQTSLVANQVLSQDAYGSSTDLTIGGSTLPVPDLAVGRLVKTPEEITSTIDHFLAKPDDAAIRPDSTLVTGYDFLADTADAVQRELTAGMGVEQDDPSAETLVSAYGTPHAESWKAEQLRDKLLGRHHDVMFLAGHFSAHDTLAADFDTTFSADELAQDDETPVRDPDDPSRPLLEDTLVVSPGCHSGYTIVDSAAGAIPTADWTQRFAQHHATLVAGTGYQYGDTDFLEYSERLYVELFEELRSGQAGTPVATGEALVRAKQDYLATLATMTGIDQKAVLEATLYGLPMTGVDLPQRNPAGRSSSPAAPSPLTSGPGATLGLSADDLSVDTGIDGLGAARTKQVPGGPTLHWFEGEDGVTSLPGAPVLPKQVVDVSVPQTVLRGVGFRSGSYAQGSGLYPLTGAPAVEGTTPHTTFYSPAFFPQQLTSSNYFDALGGRGSGGRTSLVLSPAQWRSDPGVTETTDEATATVRAYSQLGVRLFYSDNTSTYAGGNRPSLAAAPGISDVSGIAESGRVTFSAKATGDPSAGVQQVWVTWTSGPGSSGRGTWQSVDLTQDDLDSTRWTGTLDLPEGVARTDVRFVVQAVNGVGAVGLDTGDGNGYPVTLAASQAASLSLDVDHVRPRHVGVAGVVTDGNGSPVAGRAVRLQLLQGGTARSDEVVLTDAQGRAPMTLPEGVVLASGTVRVVADLLDETGSVPVDSVDRTLDVQDPATPALTVGSPVTRACPGISATVTDIDSGAALRNRQVRFTIEQDGNVLVTEDATTSTAGVATFAWPSGVSVPVGEVTVRATVVGQSSSWSFATTQVTIPQDVLGLARTELATPAGTAFPDPGVTLKDARGKAVPGAKVTFSVPSSSAATFKNGARSVQVTTSSSGAAPMPALTAGPTGGALTTLTVSAPRAASRTVTLGTQYLLTDFLAPISKNAISAKLGSTVPVKITAQQGNKKAVDDATAAALASAGRVVLSWRSGTGAWSTPVRMPYLASKDQFQLDLKTGSGFAKGTWTVRVQVLAPTGVSFDLGSRTFTLKLT